MRVIKLLGQGNFITVNKVIVEALGLYEAILLGCLCSKQDYWEDRDECTNDGYFFCTAEQFKAETTLSAAQQKKAFDKLEEAGIIQTRRVGIPARKYFRINESRLTELLIQDSEIGGNKFLKNQETSTSEIEKLVSENPLSNNIKENNIKNNIKENKLAAEAASPLSNSDSLNEVSSSVKERYTSEIKQIIDYLNTTAEKRYSYTTESNNKHIRGRLDAGYSVDDFKHVIDVKTAEWKNSEMEKFIRPSTLFAPGHFEDYLNQKPVNYSKKKEPQNIATQINPTAADISRLPNCSSF